LKKLNELEFKKTFDSWPDGFVPLVFWLDFWEVGWNYLWEKHNISL